MKKLLTFIALFAALTMQAAVFQSYNFLSDVVASSTTASGTVGYGGISITNTGTAPLGGYTNVKSWSYSGVIPGTNSMGLTWTNNTGVWIIVTNVAGPTSTTSAVGPTNLAIKWLLSPESQDLTKDIPLPPMETGGINFGSYAGVSTNGLIGGADSGLAPTLLERAMFGNCTLSCRIWGSLNSGEIANKINLIFVGVPDGQNGTSEPSSLTQTAIPAFQWGITPTAATGGSLVVVTNFPIWRFAGCGALRLRSASLTTATNNCHVTIQDLRFNGYYPRIQ